MITFITYRKQCRTSRVRIRKNLYVAQHAWQASKRVGDRKEARETGWHSHLSVCCSYLFVCNSYVPACYQYASLFYPYVTRMYSSRSYLCGVLVKLLSECVHLQLVPAILVSTRELKDKKNSHNYKKEKFSILTRAIFKSASTLRANLSSPLYESFHGFFQTKVTSPHAGNR